MDEHERKQVIEEHEAKQKAELAERMSKLGKQRWKGVSASQRSRALRKVVKTRWAKRKKAKP